MEAETEEDLLVSAIIAHATGPKEEALVLASGHQRLGPNTHGWYQVFSQLMRRDEEGRTILLLIDGHQVMSYHMDGISSLRSSL